METHFVMGIRDGCSWNGGSCSLAAAALSLSTRPGALLASASNNAHRVAIVREPVCPFIGMKQASPKSSARQQSGAANVA